MKLPATTFTCEPDPENPGWLTWDFADKTRFNAVIEMLRETRHLAFLRGTVAQGDHLVASFTGTMRKGSPKA